MKIVKLSVLKEQVEKEIYPILENQVFHLTSFKNVEQILTDGHLKPSDSTNLKQTSIHSNQSTGKALGAVCLFDLRNKSKSEIEIPRSYYDFLKIPQEDQLVYFIVNPKYCNDIVTFNDLTPELVSSSMYLPLIESWHIGKLDLSKIILTLIVNTKQIN